MFVQALVFNSLVALSLARPHSHGHAVERNLPSQWFHDDDHPVHNLFKRAAASTDGATYPAVGSPQWTSLFPATRPKKEQLPAAWFSALDAAVQSGKIPNIPVSTQPNGAGTNPVYPQGFDPNSQQVCSLTYQCRIPDVIFDAPDGVFGSSFDDGPLPPTDTLVDFLQAQGVSTTHFMIGVNIMQNPQQFLKAFNAGHDIAVHTWTHPYMTTLSNEDVLIELASTMDIIRQSTGGRIPKYWRPPFGDADIRVVAIAKQVLGMDTIKWNQDTEDWSITEGQTTVPKVISDLTGWINGPKHPGLNILEHELAPETVSAFMQAFPLIKQKGWQFAPITQLFADKTPYKNAPTALTGKVTTGNVLGAAAAVALASPPANSSTTTPPANTTKPSTPPANTTNTNTTTTPPPTKPGSAVSLNGGSMVSFLIIAIVSLSLI